MRGTPVVEMQVGSGNQLSSIGEIIKNNPRAEYEDLSGI
jgi:hypothetical protein